MIPYLLAAAVATAPFVYSPQTVENINMLQMKSAEQHMHRAQPIIDQFPIVVRVGVAFNGALVQNWHSATRNLVACLEVPPSEFAVTGERCATSDADTGAVSWYLTPKHTGSGHFRIKVSEYKIVNGKRIETTPPFWYYKVVVVVQ